MLIINLNDFSDSECKKKIKLYIRYYRMQINIATNIGIDGTQKKFQTIYLFTECKKRKKRKMESTRNNKDPCARNPIRELCLF